MRSGKQSDVKGLGGWSDEADYSSDLGLAFLIYELRTKILI